MAEQMFDIMGGEILGIRFGSCRDNRRVFQVDNLCGFKDVCFGWPDNKRRKEVGKNGEVRKC